MSVFDHSRQGLLVVAGAVAAVAACAVAGCWYVGLFTSDGRFGGLDACTLLPPPDTLAPLVAHGAREPGSSRPKTLLGWGGDASSECKWSSVPRGRDQPFRTARIHAETAVREGRTSAETQAERVLASWRRKNHAAPVRPVGVGEAGYATTDEMTVQILTSRIVIYDVHVEFRISNAVVDVSARTHSRPDARAAALVRGLAENVAERLSRTG
ncbi:hypothetical protein Airi02_084190 [Actinoallomurus iriomotensis]|uniref:Uncharacterized protein n=1 Tax=Actinoallomurus iriomotensis TaxID=478107 RepID=A0A9W6SD96_9ACTN|nr:hypothetical protein Airi02_084190 [Actinoallomurus iriomotensis]